MNGRVGKVGIPCRQKADPRRGENKRDETTTPPEEDAERPPGNGADIA